MDQIKVSSNNGRNTDNTHQYFNVVLVCMRYPIERIYDAGGYSWLKKEFICYSTLVT